MLLFLNGYNSRLWEIKNLRKEKSGKIKAVKTRPLPKVYFLILSGHTWRQPTLSSEKARQNLGKYMLITLLMILS